MIYDSVFALQWPWVGVCYHLEIIRLKTYGDYMEFPQVLNKILFDNTLIKLCIQNKEKKPSAKVMYNQLKSHSAVRKLI